MKGLIAYSSRTGNTQKLAQRLADGLANIGEWTLADIQQGISPEGYDCVLAGGWIDRAWPDKASRQWMEAIPAAMPCGLFVTMGADPSSEHGRKVMANLEKILARHERALGMAVLPGLVDEKLLARVRQMPAQALGDDGESVKQQMVEAGEQSRMPTEAEYQAAVKTFHQAITDACIDKGE
ncbi:MAG: hypothetical protein KHX08_01720 [Clostridiales bacterium]|nr:hypothetical protein [Clostridiales bacterium]